MDAARTRAGVLSALERGAAVRTPYPRPYCRAGAGPSSWEKRWPEGMEPGSPERRRLISLTGLIILGTSSLKGNVLVTQGLEGI